jgi:hypothetical protein
MENSEFLILIIISAKNTKQFVIGNIYYFI